MTKVLSRILVAAAILIGLTAQSYTPGQLAPFARFFPRPNQTTVSTDPWNALDPFGNAIACTNTTTQCLQEFLTAVAAKGWPARAYCQGTQFPSATEPVFINVAATINVPVAQDWDFEADGTCNLNSAVTTVPALTMDSEGAAHFRWNGKIVYNVTSPSESLSGTPSAVVYINPHTNTGDGFAGLYAGLTYIKATIPVPIADQNVIGAINNGSGAIRITVASTGAYATGQHKVIAGVVGTTEANNTWAITVIDGTHFDLNGSSFVHTYTSGGTVTGAIACVICINTGTGSTIQHTLEFQEVNGNNVADYGILAYGAGVTTGYIQNRVIAPQIHGAIVNGYGEGVLGTNAGNYNNNIVLLENTEMAGVVATGLSPRGIDLWGANDIIDAGAINNAQGGLQFGVVFESSAACVTAGGCANNRVRYGSISGWSGIGGAPFVDNGACNSIEGPQGSSFALYGGTSGCTKIVPAAVASGTLTAPSATDTLVARATTDTLTNKTLTSPVVNTPTVSGGTIDNATVGGTTPAAGTFTALLGKAGNGSANVRAAGLLTAQLTATGNGADTTEDTLQTYSLPANTLDQVGRGLHIEAWGTFAANVDNKTVRGYLGAALIYTSSTLTGSGFSWYVWCNVFKTGSNTQTAACTAIFQNTSPSTSVQATAITDTNAIVIKFTGQAGTANANDIVANGMTVTMLN